MNDRPDPATPTQDKPHLILDVDFVRGAFVLVLVNLGRQPAFEPRVAFSRKLVGAGGEVIVSELPIWTTLTVLIPGKRIEVFLDAASFVFRRKGSMRFRATVTYHDEAGTPYEHRYQHDLGAYLGMPQIEI